MATPLKKLTHFFQTHPVFTFDEASQFLTERGTAHRGTQKALLSYHQKRGRLLRVRRGLYVTVPKAGSAKLHRPDPFLVASKLAPDAVLAYHTALEFHGCAYSYSYETTVLTQAHLRPFSFRGRSYRSLPPPVVLSRQRQPWFGVQTMDYRGLAGTTVPVRVTSVERTLVDVLDRPDLGGGWEEIWRSLAMIERLDWESLLAYTRLLGNATTAAKVGFFLSQHQEELQAPGRVLKDLGSLRPGQVHYLDRKTRTEDNELSREWNLVVPRLVAGRAWEDLPWDDARSEDQ